MEPSVEAEFGRQTLTSGFYGPGSIACWYILIISTVLSWSFNSWQRFRITKGLIVVVAYPTIAGGHLIVQTIRFPLAKCQYLANNLANILMPDVNGPVSATTESGVYTRDLSIQDREKIFPLVASINAALRVLDNYIYLCLIALIVVILAHYSLPMQSQFRHHPLLGVLLGSLFWVWTVEMVLFVKLFVYASHGLLPIYYSLIHHLTFPVYLCVAMLCVSMTIMPIIVMIGCLMEASKYPTLWVYFRTLRSDAIESWRKTKRIGQDTTFRLVWDVVKFTCSAVFFYSVLMYFGHVVWLMFPLQILFPDVSVPVAAFNQAAVLVGGVLVLSVNAYKITKGTHKESW